MYSQEEEGSEVGPLFAVVEGWQQTAEARGYVNSLLKRNKRKSFGERERHLQPDSSILGQAQHPNRNGDSNM